MNENDKYLTIVTNQVRNISHDLNDAVGDEPHYVKYEVDGVSSLAEVSSYEVGGKTFLHVNGSDIPLSIVTGAYAGSRKADEERAQRYMF